jgi:urease accessory protein
MGAYRKAMVVAAVVLLQLAVGPAFAHHLMGGVLPGTAWQGLLSGLGHPIIGLDHLAFVLGVGVMAQLAGAIVRLPLLFVAGTVLGCALHVWGYDLPASELAIVLTVAVAAGLVATRAKVPPALLAAMFAAAGLFHGYAYGESIVGAEPSPLAAYVVGFGIIQTAIAVGSAVAFRVLVGRDYISETNARRLAAGGLALVAVVALANVALVG